MLVDKDMLSNYNSMTQAHGTLTEKGKQHQ